MKWKGFVAYQIAVDKLKGLTTYVQSGGENVKKKKKDAGELLKKLLMDWTDRAI